MATPPTDDTQVLFKLLGDGEWHDYEVIRDQVALTVPPGRALRKYQERIDYARKYKRDPSYDTTANEDERIYFGQRSCAQIVITSWKGRGIQFLGSGPGKKIRMREGFKAGGIDVGGAEPVDEAEGVPGEGSDGSEASEQGHGVPDGPAGVQTADVPQAALAEAAQSWAQAGVEALLGGPVAGGGEDPEGESYYDWPSPSVTVKPSGFTCTRCGSWVVEAELHEGFHRDYQPAVTPSGDTTYSEGRLRILMGDVMGQQLDRFQGGLQEYLVGQFEDVYAALRAVRRPAERWLQGH